MPPNLSLVLVDAETHRRNIRRKAIEGLQGVFPLKTKNYTIEMADPRVAEADFSSRQQKQAILEGRTLHEKIQGTMTVRDNSGKVVDTAKNFTLMHLPYYTQRHTFILDGNEYNVSNQIRTKPGVYTRRRGNEDLEAAFNLSKGANFRISMDPEQGHLHMEYGTTRIPLYPILRSLGVPHQDIASHWGAEVAAMNRDAIKHQDKQVDKLYEKVIHPSKQTAKSQEERIAALHTYFENTAMSPEVTEKTLGKAFDKVTPLALLAASKKLLDVHRSAIDTDDRDSLEFKTFHSVDDFIKERVGLDARGLKAKIGLKLDASGGDLRKAVPAAPFSRSIFNFLTQSSLSAVPMQINVMELLDQAAKVTSLGEGAIANERAIPLEARNLHPTHFGVMDPARTPECYAKDTEVFTVKGWKGWASVTKDDWLACRIDGRLEFHRPTNLVAQPYSGPMYGMKTGPKGTIAYLVTPNHRVFCRPNYTQIGKGNARRPGHANWRVNRADEVHGKIREFETAHDAYVGAARDTFTLPLVEGERRGLNAPNLVNVGPIAMTDWASFMGWYLSEGNTVYEPEKYGQPTYHVLISQSETAHPENCQVIEALLNRMPFSWSKRGGDTYVIGVKQLAAYLKDFGFCDDKFIPEYFFDASIEVRENLLEALMLGDGRKEYNHINPQNSESFCTTSPRLAVDFERLAISLGQPTRTARYEDKREERYLGTYEVRLQQRAHHCAFPRKGHYFIEQYNGMVYCAEVPGGLLYVRRGNTIPIWSGNSFKAGIDIRTAMSTRRDDAGNLYASVRNVKSGKEEYLKPVDMLKSVVAFPNQKIESGRLIDVMKNGEVARVEAAEVTHQIPHVAGMYGPTTNLLPFLNGMQGNRIIMASKHQSQALPLVHREAPNVQVKSWRPGFSVEQEMAQMVVPTSPVAGTVEKIDGDYIYIRPDAVKHSAVEEEFYSDSIKMGADEGLIRLHYDTMFPLAAKTFLHNDIKVKVGDKVSANQQLANSTFTKNDTLALGRNLKVGYMAYRGLNTNDGLVVSQSAADSLVSEHMYKYVMAIDGDLVVGKEKHRTYFGSKYAARQYDHLDADGVVKKGAIVESGDPLIVAVRKTAVTGSAALLGKLSKSLIKPYREEVETWDHDHPGEVIDVVTTPARITVTVKTKETINIGDKLSNRYGAKGVIAKIVPDHEMIQDEGGKPIDLLFTSAGIITRINPAQIAESAVGKVAAHLGHPIAVENFADHDNIDYARDLLKKHGLKDKETVTDPTTEKKIPGVFVGNSYILKIFKTTDSNWSAHGADRYDINQQPARGGDEGAKALGKMEFDSLVAHNARNILRESASIKSQKNDEFWRAIQLGLPTPAMKTPFAYDKFLNMLRGGGVNVSKTGSRLTLGPMTDSDVLKMSSGVIKSAKMLRAKDLMPESGGLFDPTVTGGESGTKWGHVELHEPIINPVFEEPVRRLLGQTQKGLRDLYAEKGGAHIRDELAKIDVDGKIEELKAQSKTARGPKLDDAVKQIKYLMALKKQGIKPGDAYVLTKLPIAPPVIRPIIPQKDGRLLVGDVNLLYRDALLANDRYGEVKHVLPNAELGPLRTHLHEAVGAVFGTHDPVSPTTEKRGAKGFLFQITGTRPGNGFFQSKLMKRQQDVSGRATIAPDPTLSMDEVGMPIDMLWQMYSKFVIGRLVRNGYSALDAEKMVKERHPVARDNLLAESKERPVLINRAPSLHRYNILAAYPKLTEGKTMRLNPFAEAGLSADYDGDAMQIHAPVTAAGISDAKNMTLSHLIFSEKMNKKLNVAPDMEAVIGLHRATYTPAAGEARKFKNTGEALAAYHAGTLKLDDPIVVEG